MSFDHLLANVLLDDYFELDLPEIAAAFSVKYPEFGVIRHTSGMFDIATLSEVTVAASLEIERRRGAPTQPAMPDPIAEAIEIEGCPFYVRMAPYPFTFDLTDETPHPARDWDPSEALSRCRAFISIAPREMAQDVEGRKAQAIALQAIASFIAEGTEALSIFWKTGQVFQRPEHFALCAADAAKGTMPTPAWVNYYPLRADRSLNNHGEGLFAALTLGLTAFYGREVEIAVRRTLLAEPVNMAIVLSNFILNHDPQLGDGHTLGKEDGGDFHRIRLLDQFYREEFPCWLMIAPDSLIDGTTLKPKKKPGVVARLFGRK